jgi:hypothetical protein
MIHETGPKMAIRLIRLIGGQFFCQSDEVVGHPISKAQESELYHARDKEKD